MKGENLELVVKKGRSTLLSGPASINLVRGKANILGANMHKDKRVVVSKERQLAIETEVQSSFELILGEGANYKIIQGSTIPDSWKRVIEEVMSNNYRKIIVIGGVDSGKSTFCVFMANSFLKSGIQTALIDADIGQSDLGPPTTVGLGLVTDNIMSLSLVEVISLFFVGHIKPNHVANKVILGIKKFSKCLKTSLPIIINTDGWIESVEATAYKKRMIDEVFPDLIVSIGKKIDVNCINKNFENNFRYLSSSEFVKKRSREERRKLRECGYRRYLRKASLNSLSLDRTKIEPVKYIESKNRLVGLIDKKGLLLGIGILKSFDKMRGVMKIYTPVEKNKELCRIEIGFIRLSEFGREF